MKKKALSFVLVLAMLLSISASALALSVTWSASLDKTEVSNDQDQTVVLTLMPSTASSFDAFDYIINCPAGLEITGFASGDSRITFTGANYNKNYAANQAKVSWNSSEAENVESVAKIAEITVKIPAGTVPGDYKLSFSEINASADYGTSWASKGTSNEVTLKVTGDPVSYSASMSADQETMLGENVSVSISASSEKETFYNSYYYELSYDSSKLQYVSADEGVNVKSSVTNKLVVTGYGSNKAFSSPVTLTFKGVASGESSVKLTAAKIDKNSNAVSQDAPAATIKDDTTVVTVGGYRVTLSDDFTGAASAASGADYTFTAKDKNYNYTFTATMNGVTAAVVDNKDGTFTIKGANGPIVINATKAPKTFTVTATGSIKAKDGTSATYLTDYHFTRESDEGYNYPVTITIGGAAFTGYSTSENTYTIPGASITGNIVITVGKEAILPDYYAASITGSGAGDASTPSQAARTGNAVLTLTPVAGYDYTVTATMDGKAVTVKTSGNTYTVENVSGDVVFTVDKVGQKTVTISKYLTLGGGKSAWLVKVVGTLESGNIFAYDGNAMFYSSEYESYCYLVISSETEETVKEQINAKIGLVTATATNISYDGDVNMTGKLCINDAQLVWNLYNTLYGDFTTCSMEKFLRADVNGDAIVDTQDAAAVVSLILK